MKLYEAFASKHWSEHQRCSIPFSRTFGCKAGYDCLVLWLPEPLFSLPLGGQCVLHPGSAWPRNGAVLADTLESVQR